MQQTNFVQGLMEKTKDYAKNLKKKTRRYARKLILDDAFANETYQPSSGHVATDILKANQSLSSILNYDVYDAKTGLFFNDGTIGFMFELIPQTGANENMEQKLRSLYSSAPADTGIQFILTGMPDSSSLFDRYVELRKQAFDRGDKNAKLYVELAQNHTKHIHQGELAPMWSGDPFTIKNFRVILSVIKSGSFEDSDVIHELQNLRETYEQTLNSAGFPAMEMDADDLINWLYPIVNAEQILSEEPRPKLNHDPYKSIKAQIRERGLIKQHYDRLVFSGKDEIEVRSYSVMSYPRKIDLSQMGGLIGDFMDGAMQYPCPFMITLGVYTLEHDKVKALSDIKSARAEQNASSQMAKYQPELEKQKQDWKIVAHRLDEGHSMCDLYHQLTLFCPSQRMQAAESRAISIWRSRGFTLARDYFTALASFYVSLPMTLSSGVRDDLKTFERISTKTTDNAINMSPIIGEWKGFGDEVMMLLGRRGQPTFVDFFANHKGNFNVNVTGVPGAGKSVFMQYIMQSYLSVGSKGWIFDLGRSFQKFVDVNGGEYIEFCYDRPICLNPYSWVVKFYEEDVHLIKPLAARMAQADGPYQMGLIEQAVIACYEEYKEKATITDVQQYLMQKCLNHHGKIDEEAYRLGIQLTPFCKGGMYADFFNGPATISMKADLVALELEELSNAPELLSSVMFVMMHRVTYEMYLMSRERRKIAMLDEAWNLLGEGSATATFIEHGYRRARKYNGSFITGTQGVGDFIAKDTGKAMPAYEFSDWKAYFRQDGDAFKQLNTSGALNLTSSEERMIASLNAEAGKYSEILLRNEDVSAVLRLVLDPFFLEMASSKAADFNAFHALKKQGIETTEAIYQIMRNKGYGTGGYRHVA